MNKEYWLIHKITTIGHRNPFQIRDMSVCSGLREAENKFKSRNDFKKLLRKGDLIITESKRWIQ